MNLRRLIAGLGLTHLVFRADRYWEKRHRKLRGSIRSVGAKGLSDEANQADYELKNRKILEMLLRFGHGEGHARLLDAGCGIGAVSVFFASQGFSIVGIDFSETAIAHAQKTVPGDFHAVGLCDYRTDEPFDVILCLDVLYHVVDDAQWSRTLAHFGTLLKDRGVLIIQECFTARSEGYHLRWRRLEDYNEFLPTIGLTLTAAETYFLPRENIEKTVLAVTKSGPRMAAG